MQDSERRSKLEEVDSRWAEYEERLSAKESGMAKMPYAPVPKIYRHLDRSPAWMETQAQVTACHYEFARLNVLTLGYASDTKHFSIYFTYYAHGKTFGSELNSSVAMEKGQKFSIFYNPLNPQQNSVSNSGSCSGWQISALGIAGSIVISLIYLSMMQGCN
jgi:hypothetical protein